MYLDIVVGKVVKCWYVCNVCTNCTIVMGWNWLYSIYWNRRTHN